MRNISHDARDDLRRTLRRERVLIGDERMRARVLLHHAVRMAANLVLRIAVSAVEITALKAHKDLTASDVLPLPLDGGKDLNDVLAHISPSYR